jgi:hypothetical protein
MSGEHFALIFDGNPSERGQSLELCTGTVHNFSPITWSTGGGKMLERYKTGRTSTERQPTIGCGPVIGVRRSSAAVG